VNFLITRLVVYIFCFNLGETVKPLEWARFTKFLKPFNIRIISVFGMTEFNLAVGSQLQNIDCNSLPLGYPLPGYRCLLIDEQGQVVRKTGNLSEIGQIHLGGRQYSFQLLF
jgi:acyl-coenzyme A synthetase/AMP-(fatty) acid ligase